MPNDEQLFRTLTHFTRIVNFFMNYIRARTQARQGSVKARAQSRPGLSQGQGSVTARAQSRPGLSQGQVSVKAPGHSRCDDRCLCALVFFCGMHASLPMMLKMVHGLCGMLTSLPMMLKMVHGLCGILASLPMMLKIMHGLRGMLASLPMMLRMVGWS